MITRLKNTSSPAAVVMGMSANGLSVARSLGRKDIPVFALSSSHNEPGMFSRYSKGRLLVESIINDSQAEKTLIEKLLIFGQQSKVRPILFPTADEYIIFISKYRESLEKHFDFLLPPHDLVIRLIDKQSSYRLAESCGVLYPKTFFLSSDEDAVFVANSISYPCIFKPLFSYIWREKYKDKKVAIVASRKEFLEMHNELERSGIKALAQEIVQGPDSNIYLLMAYFNKESVPLASFCCRKLRQHPPHFGIGSFVVSVYEERIMALGMEFLRKIKYKGLINLEFKLDRNTLNPIFIEANLRTCFVGELSVACGIDLPYIAYKNIAFKDDETTESNFKFPEGIKLTNLTLDFGSFLLYWKNKEMSFLDWLKSFRSKKFAHTYFCFDDLMPFIRVYVDFFSYKIKKIIALLQASITK